MENKTETMVSRNREKEHTNMRGERRRERNETKTLDLLDDIMI